MNKFPALNLYCALANILAALVLLGGLLVSFDAATTLPRYFDFLRFLGVFLPFVGAAIGLRLLAEVIALALKIERHLDQIARSTTLSSSALISDLRERREL